MDSLGYWPKIYVADYYSAFNSESYAEGWSWSDAAISGDSGTPVETVPYKNDWGGLLYNDNNLAGSNPDRHLKIVNGDLQIGTSGHGIDFSATAGPTNGTDSSELLNDYEEGSWTPIFYGSTGSEGSFSYGYRLGYYTKVGRLVNVFCNIYTTSIGSYTGNMRIRNFPFAPDTNIESVAATQWNSLASGSGANNQAVFAILQHPNTHCEFRQNHSGTNQFTYMPVQNVTYLRFSMTYMT